MHDEQNITIVVPCVALLYAQRHEDDGRRFFEARNVPETSMPPSTTNLKYAYLGNSMATHVVGAVIQYWLYCNIL